MADMFETALEEAATQDGPPPAVRKVQAAAAGLTPELAGAVRAMAKQWSSGRITGPALDHWNRIYAGLCVGRTSVGELREAAALADAAFLLQQGRPSVGS